MNNTEKKRTLIFIGCCTYGLVFVGLICNTIGLYFTGISEDLSVTMTQVGIMMSCLNAGGLLGMTFAGRLITRAPLRPVLASAVFAAGGGIFLSAFAKQILIFYIVWFLIGLCTPLLMTVAVPTILGNWFTETFGLRMGITYGAAGIGGAVFSVILGALISAIGWREAMAAEGIFVILAMLPFALFVFELSPQEAKRMSDDPEIVDRVKGKEVSTGNIGGISSGEAVKTGSFYLFLIAGMALTVVSSLLQQVSAHIVNIGYDIRLSSLVMSSVMAGCAIGNVLNGRLLDKKDPVYVTVLYMLFGAAGWCAMAVLRQPLLLGIAGFLLGMGQSVFQVAIPFLVRRRFGGLDYSQIYASLCLPGSVVGIFSASLGGIFFDRFGNYHLLLGMLAVMYLIAGPALVLTARRKYQ